MEQNTPQAFTEEEVTDIDIQFTTDASSFTLFDGDTYNFDPDGGIDLTFGGSHTPVGRVHVYPRNILWYSVRRRTVRTPVKPFVPSGTGPEPTSGRVVGN